MDVDDLIDWARDEAAALQAFQLARSLAPGAAFLARHGDAVFAAEARRALDGDTTPDGPNNRRVRIKLAQALTGWANYVEAGLADELPLEARIRVGAATDLMEQVQRLLDDPDVHPAAPVMLAGAALEETLRSLHVGCPEPIVGRLGISAYATALQKAGTLSKQDAKDVTAWAGQRNDAAHGDFDKLDPLRAQIMVDGINHFMRTHTPTAART